MDYSGFWCAIRDPKTKKIFTGSSHASAQEYAFEEGNAIARRIFVELQTNSNNVGFVDANDVFYTRKEAKEKFGFGTSVELGNLKSKSHAS